MSIISTRDLTKKYRQVTAVDRLTLEVDKGIIYGFLGLNGAGKTTTMRMLLGMINPSSGTYSLFENKYPKNQVWTKVGYMIESTHAYPDLSVRENLKLFFNYYGLERLQAINEIVEEINLGRYEKTKAKYLSLGNLQRLGIAKALLHKPELLMLDEPVNGLDPAGIVEIRELLKNLSRDGVTIFISSHLLGEISKIADKIGIIHEGMLIREITTDELSGHLQKKLIVDTNDNKHVIDLLHNSEFALKTDHRGEVEITGEKIADRRSEIARYLINKELELKKMFLWEEDLEQFFLRTIKRSSEP